MKLEFKEVAVPGDGNCLFYSLGKAFHISQQNLRNNISTYLLKNKKKKINDMMLQDWVKLEKDVDIEEYANIVKKSGFWGGNMELNVCSNIYKVNIFILEKSSNKYKIVSTYIWNNKSKNVFLLYDGAHYNYLSVSKNLAGINV